MIESNVAQMNVKNLRNCNLTEHVKNASNLHEYQNKAQVVNHMNLNKINTASKVLNTYWMGLSKEE